MGTRPDQAVPATQNIDKLTPEQEARMPIVRDEWIAHGLSTEPANREQAELGVDMAYRAAGLEPPPQKIWCDSPYAGCEMVARLLHPRATGKRLQRYARDQISTAIWAQYDADWMAFYDFFNFLECTKPLQGLQLVAKSAGWWWAFDQFVVLTERPRIIKRDNQGRLHSLEGPALQYPDGDAIYAVQGTRVPAEWIEERETLDPSIALTWENVDQRTAAAQIIGWDRVLEQFPVRVIHEDPDPLIGSLIEVDLPDAPGSRFLRAQCGTGRPICIAVTDDASTAREAGASSYDMSEDEYEPEIRT